MFTPDSEDRWEFHASVRWLGAVGAEMYTWVGATYGNLLTSHGLNGNLSFQVILERRDELEQKHSLSPGLTLRLTPHPERTYKYPVEDVLPHVEYINPGHCIRWSWCQEDPRFWRHRLASRCLVRRLMGFFLSPSTPHLRNAYISIATTSNFKLLKA